MKKAIVTGGLGFLGSHLVDKLLQKNIEIINFDSHENIYETYINAYKNRKPIILVEYPEKYYE